MRCPKNDSMVDLVSESAMSLIDVKPRVVTDEENGTLISTAAQCTAVAEPSQSGLPAGDTTLSSFNDLPVVEDSLVPEDSREEPPDEMEEEVTAQQY